MSLFRVVIAKRDSGLQLQVVRRAGTLLRLLQIDLRKAHVDVDGIRCVRSHARLYRSTKEFQADVLESTTDGTLPAALAYPRNEP